MFNFSWFLIIISQITMFQVCVLFLLVFAIVSLFGEVQKVLLFFLIPRYELLYERGYIIEDIIDFMQITRDLEKDCSRHLTFSWVVTRYRLQRAVCWFFYGMIIRVASWRNKNAAAMEEKVEKSGLKYYNLGDFKKIWRNN